MAGAVDLDACPRLDVRGYRHATNRQCHCKPKCAVCGWGPHAAIHGPKLDNPPGSEPWGHEYVPGVED